ncbi:AfsR/SARP family transcriptional regulator [Inediibacterium massiliense]|uniref:AfsR/SARP family transcriptional regulator n=1 Tax=Inediibacterium massiliense TaxID=1658111 RepID=UPI0006B4CB10|nr:BTAD domain-containing putative transcriptional regulator [Inediibacterium massiliense]
MAKLEIYMLGNLKIIWNGKSIVEKLSNKATALLCYLAVNQGKKFSRDKLATYFWDASNMDSARYNLRYNLWSLRKIIKQDKAGQDMIISRKDTCMINPNANLYIDVIEMNELYEGIKDKKIYDYRNELNKIKNLYKGEFLEEFYIKKCMEFNDWIFYEREKYQRKYIDILHKLIYIYKKNHEYVKAIDLLEEMIKINPLKEELYVELIQIYIELGDRDAAIHQYDRCCTTLREELNIGPMESTKKIYEKIKESKTTINRFEMFEEKGTSCKLDINSHIICNPKNDSQKIQKQIYKGKKIIENPCYPLGIDYYWISNLIETFIMKYEEEDLKKLRPYYWKDILRIQSKVLSIDDTLVVTDQLSIKTEKNRIFSGVENLLNLLIQIKPMVIFIKNVHYIDEYSFQFLKYYLFKNQYDTLHLVLYGDENHSKMKELKKIVNCL